MTVHESVNSETRQMWAMGDYHRFAKQTVWEVGLRLAEACAIAPGQHVLDVAAGTGNTAVRAALAGARVVACDLTPENFPAGRREAAEQGVELEWVEADAQALPFEDDAFDTVTSSFGAMFAPDHRAVARELVRVCRPGGTIGLASFTPEGLIADFFGALAPYSPEPPPGAEPPPLWGSEDHVRDLLGGAVELTMTRESYVERAPSPQGYVEMFKETFGPVVATFAAFADDPATRADLDRDLLDFATRCDSGPAGGPSAYRYEYLLVVGRVRSG